MYENIRRHRLASNKEHAKMIVDSYAHEVTHIQKIESMLRILQPHAPELQNRFNPIQQPLNQRADSAAHRPRRQSVPIPSNRNSLGDDGEREQVCKPDSLAWTSESFARCACVCVCACVQVWRVSVCVRLSVSVIYTLDRA